MPPRSLICGPRLTSQQASVDGRCPTLSPDVFESSRHGRVFVAEQQGEIVGALALYGPGAPARVITGPDEAELSRLAVASSVRRMGIGRALVHFCEERARAAGWTAIVLWSRPAQVEAHRLYESVGYRRVPERDSLDDAGHARLVFCLEL